MAIELVTALGALQAIPSIYALAAGAKDSTTKAVLVAGAVVAALLGLEPLVGALHDLIGGSASRVLALIAAGLGIATAVRVPDRIVGTLAATAGGLLALLAWGIVR